ncbi:MAG: SDR family oxidoreductase [Phenylobacterium sp.]|nr:MAG: SDR family oxidoreductase [Phenylobacterium sp.]
MMKPAELFDLSGKTALVTGGSSGLGFQIAQALAAAGARVVISSRSAENLRDAQGVLRAGGLEVEYIAADNSDERDLVRLADEALSGLGKVDILVNNAGGTAGGPAEDHSLEEWDRLMSLNVRALFVLSQRVAKTSMIPNRYGRILNVASIAGLRGVAGNVAYATSKAAVISLTQNLAVEWGPYGITVNALAPGLFPSKMTARVFDAFGVERFANATPLRRIGDDEDLMGAALLFVSRGGKHITGQTLAIDGGISAAMEGEPKPD